MSDLEPNLKIGDLVQLKSGGPCMTVLDVKATVKCGWFTEGRYYDACFPDDCLERSVLVKIQYAPQPARTSYRAYYPWPDNVGEPYGKGT